MPTVRKLMNLDENSDPMMAVEAATDDHEPTTGDAPALPPGWEWTTVELIADVIDPHPSHRTPSEVENGISYVGMGDIKEDGSFETQLTRLDAGVAALRAAQAKLKRYKASVLKAACEGRLVAQEASDEPADVLLQRILAERRAHWEAAQIAKMEAQGRMVLDDGWRDRYQEPAPPDTRELPNLPEGWRWVHTEIVAEAVDPHPSHRTPPEVDSGVPYVGMGDIRLNRK